MHPTAHKMEPTDYPNRPEQIRHWVADQDRMAARPVETQPREPEERPMDTLTKKEQP